MEEIPCITVLWSKLFYGANSLVRHITTVVLSGFVSKNSYEKSKQLNNFTPPLQRPEASSIGRKLDGSIDTTETVWSERRTHQEVKDTGSTQ